MIPRDEMFPRRLILMVALALAVAACGEDSSEPDTAAADLIPAQSFSLDGDSSEPDTAAADLIPAQSFSLDVDWADDTPLASGEAHHRLLTRSLDEVLSGRDPDNRGEDHALELVGSDGTVLESHPVHVSHVAVDPGPDFEQWEAVFEDPPDYASLRFVHGSRTVHEQTLSPNAPEVSFLGLEHGQVFAGDAQFWFRLLIHDKDGDDLEMRILVSVDGGAYEHDRAGFIGSSFFQGSSVWELKVDDYGSPLTVSSGVRTQKIPRIVAEGSEAVRLLAVVSDGGRVTAAQSPVFALEPFEAQDPTVEIQIMPDGQVIEPRGVYRISALVVEEGYQDGDLRRFHIYFPQPVEDPAVRWTSDIDGDITEHINSRRKAGGLIEIDQSPRRWQTLDAEDPITDVGLINTNALTPGTHELIATFTADSGLKATDSITITVLAPDDPSQPLK